MSSGFGCRSLREKTLILAALLCFALENGSSKPNCIEPRPPDDWAALVKRIDRQLFREVNLHSQLKANLEHLTTIIGPRLTGSPQMELAARWAAQRFDQYGLQARLEPVQVAHGWARGEEIAELLEPTARAIKIHAAGWSAATPGLITGDVLPVVGKTAGELRSYVGKVKNRIVLDGAPLKLVSSPQENSFSALLAIDDGLGQLSESEFEERQQMLGELSAEGPAVVLMDSGKSHGLFNMGTFSEFEPTRAPMAFLTHEDYVSIFNMAKDHNVRMRVRLEANFTEEPATASNVIAEIRGLSPERVMIAAHLDSWDLGQGAIDNGVGAMAVLEAARAIKALDITPARTLVFALFTGEEEGKKGAKSFIKTHKGELKDIDAILVIDGGTGKVIGMSLGRSPASPITDVYAPLAEVFALQPADARRYSGSDHDEFSAAGVPSYICVQSADRYLEVHHSQLDRLELTDFLSANQAAAYLAAWMWNTAQFSQRMPHP